MQLVFTKGSGKYDRMEVVRDDGAVEAIDCPKQRIIPHDMVHYAVESTLEKRGFLTRVREGARADFRMAPEAESDGVERLVEVIQGDAWSNGNSEAADMLDLYRVTCIERDCPMLPVGAGDIEAIRARFTELSAEWDALPVGESLTLRM
ncbi:MAG TPA: hypothetical protein VFK08_04295 [Rhodanobacteraceae bacterium]|jgi:hypothetical protein|nr:hypothetical protein [Rhodanobacteraceae bacterium]